MMMMMMAMWQQNDGFGMDEKAAATENDNKRRLIECLPFFFSLSLFRRCKYIRQVAQLNTKCWVYRTKGDFHVLARNVPAPLFSGLNCVPPTLLIYTHT